MPISQPPFIEVPFAESGLKNAIPANANNVTGNAGFDLGFPPINLTAVAAGGIPPYGQDMNGILYEITQNLQYQQTGTAFVYDASFAASISGYPKGAKLLKLDGTAWWLNTLAGNTSDPDAGGANWIEFPFTGPEGPAQIQPISASVSANALTISASALSLEFRSTVLGSGATTSVVGTPANLVISSGSTLGTVNGVQSEIAVLAINNAGTIELAAVNIAGGNDLSETGLISTTAEGGAGGADSANVIYSSNARTNVAYRVIGVVRSTQAVAGAWATPPSLIQGAGGNALTSMQSIGYGQTIQDLTGSRSFSTTYYNTTGKPIVVFVRGNSSTGNNSIFVSINGSASTPIASIGAITGLLSGVTIIPAAASYQITATSITLSSWSELR